MSKIITEFSDPKISYTGRVDMSDGATMCWPGAEARFKFRGTEVTVYGENDNFGWPTVLGATVDGREEKMSAGSGEVVWKISGLEDKEHEVSVYKRMEGHYFTLRKIETDGELLDPPKKPSKRIEVYGDSVSAGSVVDAVEYVGKPDPEENSGQWDNSLHAYPQLIAKLLPAEVYDTSQGGIAIFDRTGYFEMPDTRGVESCFDKVRYSSYRPQKIWDFRFKPHVIIMAVGQNDAYPDPDCIKNPEGYEKWVNKYIEIINAIRSHSPKAAVVLALTVLQHDPIWDDALEDISKRLGGPEGRAYHFMYTRCGKATPGHPRVPEQEEMAREMTAFLKSLPENIWED